MLYNVNKQNSRRIIYIPNIGNSKEKEEFLIKNSKSWEKDGNTDPKKDELQI